MNYLNRNVNTAVVNNIIIKFIIYSFGDFDVENYTLPLLYYKIK